MAQFSSRELYLMNGGNKLYIFKDGFGDEYSATEEEESGWREEIIARDLLKLREEENSVVIKSAIENLRFHQYPDLSALLLELLTDAGLKRKILLANCLWLVSKYEKSFFIIHDVLISHPDEFINDVFNALQDFKDNVEARFFLVNCLAGTDDVLMQKSRGTLVMWSYTGIPLLRTNNLLDVFTPLNRGTEHFLLSLAEVRRILGI